MEGASGDDFGRRLASLDLALFERIPSQTSSQDQRSLLACQLAARTLLDGYGYLEIGSYLGGSIQPHLLDPLCRDIISIDKRPAAQPDGRGVKARYRNNSTQRMLENLSLVQGGGEGMRKLTCFESDSGELDPAQIEASIDLCLIDGEHTDDAVLRDFQVCIEAISGRGAIVFHDAWLVHGGLAEIVRGLGASGAEFHAYNLPDGLMVFELGGFPVHQHPLIASRLLDNHIGYLASFEATAHLLRWANLPPLRLARSIRGRLKGNYCE